MRAGNREVNIFNMSLLDILCGALGAFCFMMLGLFPYYKPMSNSDHPIDPKTLEEAKRDIATLRQQLQQFQTALERMQRENDQLARQNQNLDQQRRQAEAQAGESAKRVKRLEIRNPLAVQIWWYGADYDIDLWIEDNLKTADGKMSPRFDPAKKPGVYWPGDNRSDDLSTPGSEAMLLRDVPPADYHLYYNLYKVNEAKPNAPKYGTVDGLVLLSNGKFISLGKVLIGPEQKTCDVGIIRVNTEHELAFIPSEEFKRRQEELKQLRAKQQANGGA